MILADEAATARLGAGIETVIDPLRNAAAPERFEF